MATPRSTGATPIGDDSKKGSAWWKWLLAVVLILLVIFAIVLISSGGDDDKTAATSTAPPAAAQPAPVDPATTPTDTSTSATTGSSGTLTADGASLLGTSSIADADGNDATGMHLEVLAVEDAGFFVGTSDTDRVFVEYGGDVGVDEQESYDPKVGDIVDLEGPVAEAPKDPATTLKVDDATATSITKLGGYVNADAVTKTT